MSIIEVRDVKKTYPLGKVEVHAVKGVNFSIEKGDFISIAGPSGSGKSTILNMIGLIDKPSAGEVFIEGKPTSGLSDKELTRLRHEVLGFIFQSFNLIPVLNVWENIEFPLLLGKTRVGAAEKKEWIDWLIDEVGLGDWRTHKPNELSGGHRPGVRAHRQPGFQHRRADYRAYEENKSRSQHHLHILHPRRQDRRCGRSHHQAQGRTYRGEQKTQRSRQPRTGPGVSHVGNSAHSIPQSLRAPLKEPYNRHTLGNRFHDPGGG